MIENQLKDSRIIIPVGPGKIYDVDVEDLLQVIKMHLLLLLLLLLILLLLILLTILFPVVSSS